MEQIKAVSIFSFDSFVYYADQAPIPVAKILIIPKLPVKFVAKFFGLLTGYCKARTSFRLIFSF